MTKRSVLFTFLMLASCARFEAGESSTALNKTAALAVRNDDAIEIRTDDRQVPHVTTLRVLSYQAGVDQTLRARISWRARGGGTLQIEGPEGVLIATGVVLPNGHAWFRDVQDEKPVSQLFARGVAFGTSDPVRLKDTTLKWLNEVVAPELDRRLAAAPSLP